MVNISNARRDDSLSFYKSLSTSDVARNLLSVVTEQPTPADKVELTIKPGYSEVTITGDSHITVPAQTEANVFFTLAENKGGANLNLYLTIIIAPGATANFFWQKPEGSKPQFIKFHYRLQESSRLNDFTFLDLSHAVRMERDVYLEAPHAVACVFVAGKNTLINHDMAKAIPQNSGNGVAPKEAGEEKISKLGDSTIRVIHQVPETTSQIIVRGVVDYSDIMIAQVCTDIDIAATNANTAQDIKAMVLSPSAKFYGKPELNIKHDKVKATHGLSVGAIDDDQLYYLRARGIDHKTAKKLLLGSFFMNGLRHFSGDVLNTAWGWLTPLVDPQ